MAKKKDQKAPKAAKAKRTWKVPVKTIAKRARLAAAAAKNQATRVKQPRQAALIEDARIKQLDDIGAAYADIRDQRIALNQEEHSLKQTALDLMHRHGKVIYRHEAIEIVVQAGDESIRVKVLKPKEAVADSSDQAALKHDDDDDDDRDADRDDADQSDEAIEA